MRRAGIRMQSLLLGMLKAQDNVIVGESTQIRAFGQLCLQKADSTLWKAEGQRRCFQMGRLLHKDIEVEIQQMGESISEGTIAEILKKEGESVDEDETIAQIETDKVTIDVKAPSAGTLKSLKVNVDDTVTVGQVVAIIGEGEASGSDDSSSSAGQATAEKPAKTQPKDSSADEAQSSNEAKESSSQGAEEGESHSSAYSPMLKFPQRMTSEGQRISELPAEEQKQHVSHGKTDSQQGRQTKASEPAQTKSNAQPSSQSSSSYMPWYVGREQGTKLSQSSVLSEYEMEQIELGGAAP